MGLHKKRRKTFLHNKAKKKKLISNYNCTGMFHSPKTRDSWVSNPQVCRHTNKHTSLSLLFPFLFVLELLAPRRV